MKMDDVILDLSRRTVKNPERKIMASNADTKKKILPPSKRPMHTKAHEEGTWGLSY